MITVMLQGRTGNNLFQYAAGRALADRLGTDLVLEGSWADATLESQFRQIFRFPLRARYRRRFSVPKRLMLRYLKQGPERWHRGPIHRETGVGHDAELGTLGDGTLLAGYFQSPANFEASAPALRRDLDPYAIQLAGSSLHFAENLKTQTTVSLHVRRGDYLNISSTDCLGEDYHDRAILWFEERFPDCRFCIFSDDIPWCRERFREKNFLHCDLPDSATDPLHDLILMSGCHHHIIVNSSYSWWGAWLNPSSSKKVLAPRQWMVGMTSEGVIPEDWITV
jgi:hypothetical protein